MINRFFEFLELVIPLESHPLIERKPAPVADLCVMGVESRATNALSGHVRLERLPEFD